MCWSRRAFYNHVMSFDQRPLAIFLMGPTASAMRARHPHALVDIRDPAQPYSAADFCVDALSAMRKITGRGHVPLLVGGTGLYFRALQQGLSDLPAADPLKRARLAAEAARIGWPAMHARLAQIDPIAAARIGCNDTQRLQRALEVIELTGRPLSAQQQQRARTHFPWRVLKLALLPGDRGALHQRIAQRFDAMLVDGLLDEVRALRARGDLHDALPAIRAVGYRQAWEHLDGLCDAKEFRDRAIFATRQLAKRQLTWLRGEVDARGLTAERAGLRACAVDAAALFLADGRLTREGQHGASCIAAG
jgi:tRNA dimethylallyltransferase